MDGPAEFESFFGFSHQSVAETIPGIATSYQKKDTKILSQVVVSPSKLDFMINGVIRITLSSGDPANPPEFQVSPDESIIPAQDLGLFRQQISNFLRRVDSKSILRLALGVDYQQNVPNRDSGYEALGRKLHSVTLNPKTSNEFLYRINRPEFFEVSGEMVPINRLNTWTCAGLNYGVKPEGSDRVEKMFFYAKVAGDYNTSPAFNASILSEESQIKVVDRFFENAEYVATKGEFP